MRAKEFIVEADSYSPPTLNVGDRILKGKFKNSPAGITGFTKDKHNQPVLKTNRGEVQLFKPRVTKLMDKDVAEGSENNNPIANKIFFARSNKAPKGWSYDHVGFITQDGKQIQMSGHKGNDVYVTNAVTDDPEFPKQNIKIVSLSKPVSVPTTNSVGAENCGTFVANVLQANGIKGINTQKIYSVFKKPQEQGVAEGTTVTRIDSNPITDFGSSLKAYKHTDDWSQSGVDTGDDSYWKNKNLKTNTTKGLFAGDPKRTALYATGNAHETRYVEFTQNGQPIVYFDRKDLPAMRSRKTYLTVFDASDFRQLPTGEWFSENPSKPIKQVPIGDPFKYIADQGWIVRVTDNLDKVFKQVQNMHKAGKIAQYGAEGMNESKQGVAEGLQNIEIQDDTISVGGKERFVLQPATGHKLKSYGGGAYKYWTIYDIERKKDRFNPNIGMMSKNQAIAYVNKIIKREEDAAKVKPGVAEDRPIPKAESGKAVALSNLGKFHAGVDTLGKWVPERLTHQFALDPNKWEHTFYSLTLKEPKKIRYYRPKNVDIVPGTLVGDMAIANQFYRTKDPAEQEQYALAYLASLKPYPVNLDDYEFPELLIPRKEQGVAEGTEEVNPLTNAVISFYKPVVNQIEPGAVDDYVKKAKELLNQAPDPTIRSRMLEIFRKGQKDPMIQGGVITAIAAILTGGLLSSASRMGLSPAQTNILLQAVLNTVIPTIIARINNKSWRDTIKYTLASVGVGMTAAATLSEKRVTEGLSIDVPNEQWLQDKIDYAKSKGRDEWGAPFFGSVTAYVRPNPQVSVVRLELLKGMRNEQNNVRKTDLEWLMAYMEKTGKLPPDPHGNEYAPFVMVAYNGEAWVNEGNHRIMAAFRLGWKKMPIEIKYFDGGERVESGIMYPGKIGLGQPAANPVREAYTGPTLKWLKPGELRGSYTDQQMRDRGFDRAGNGKWFILQDRWNELIAKKGIQ